MELKLSFFRAAILFWLSVSLAGQFLFNLPYVSAMAASSPSGQTIGQTMADQTANKEADKTRNFDRAQGHEEATFALSDKQKRDILKSNFEKTKHDVDQLVDLTKQLQGELEKSNENVLSLGVIDKVDKIEKLAKKIKSSAQGERALLMSK